MGDSFLQKCAAAAGNLLSRGFAAYLRLLRRFGVEPQSDVTELVDIPAFKAAMRNFGRQWREADSLASKPVILEEALRFQGDLVHLIQEPLPRHLRGTLEAVGLLFALGLLVSIVVKVDVVVQGRGKLTYDGQPMVLQPFEHTVLRSLLVKPGDAVRKGQVLATLDPTFSQADLVSQEARQQMVRAQVKRLQAEVDGTEYMADPQDGVSGALQAQIFSQRKMEYQLRMKSFTETLEETRVSLSKTESEKSLLEEQLAISSTVEEMQGNLLKINTNSKLEYLSAKSNRLRSERDFRDAGDRAKELRHRLESVQSQRDAFEQEWRRAALEELTRQMAEEAQIDAQVAKFTRISSMVVITAPEDGVVLEVANRSAGSVMRDAEPLVILVPTSAPLMCEIQLSSAEIGDAAVGDHVLVKVDAYPFHRYGALNGRVRSIGYDSHSTSLGASGDIEALANKRADTGAMHRVAVELDETRLKGMPSSRNLFPGMTAEGEIRIGERRIIAYILGPIINGFRESFRER